jgi:hypothetical protein
MGIVEFLKRRCGALILIGASVYSLVYALAFVQLYFQEHPYKVASYWIFDNVAPGSRIVGPHWDDKVPVSVAGKNTSMYVMEGRDNELPVYERDTPQTLDLLVRRISLSDYIMFPTARTPDSIPRIPDEYPNTSALLRLLWGEKLGFKLVKTVKNRPSFLGVTFNDDLADESFSVYDHPKVVIFQNTEKLSQSEIAQRIKEVQRYEPLPSMNEMLLMDTGGWQATPPLWKPEIKVLVGGVSLLVLVGISAWILTGRMLGWMPDGGLGVSVALGAAGTCLIAWLLAAAGLLPFSRNAGIGVLVAIVVFAFGRVSLRGDLRDYFLERGRSHGVYLLLAVVAGAIVSVVMRTSDPGFFGLGEDVDAAYLSYLTRSEQIIPQDIFTPAAQIPPQVLDRFVLGWLLKVLSVDAALAVKMAAALLGAMIAAATYAAFAMLVRRPRVVMLSTLIALIPAAYLLHVVRDSASRGIVIGQLGNGATALTRDVELESWVRRNIVGTPCFIAACGVSGFSIQAAAIGLPACKAPLLPAVQGEGEQAGEVDVCEFSDPQAVFNRMMRSGIELFITPSVNSESDVVRTQRYVEFGRRPELFAKVFDNGHTAVFVPAFSRYFPRSKDSIAS